MSRVVFISISLILSLSAISQNITVIRDYGGKEVVSDPSQYKLVGSTEHTMIIEHYELISDKDRDELINHIISSIDFYLDQVIEFSDGHMSLRKTRKEILRELNGIVDKNIELYNYQVDEEFTGFSEDIEERLAMLERLTWDTQAQRDNAAYNSIEMAYNYVQARVTDLKNSSSRELIDYADTHVHRFVGNEIPLVTEVPTMEPDTEAFDPKAPLEPLDFTLASMDIEDIGLIIEPDVVTEEIPIGANKEIVELLKANNDLLQDFAEQMLNLQRQILELQKDGQEAQREYRMMRDDVDALQAAMVELRANSGQIVDEPISRPIDPNKNYIIRFKKNSTNIGLEDQLVLNEIFKALMTEPDKKLMITGYADKSGNAELNAAISKERAMRVKRYLVSKGSRADRLLVNHLGDSESNSENARDRKVELTWVSE